MREFLEHLQIVAWWQLPTFEIRDGHVLDVIAFGRACLAEPGSR